MALHYNLSKVYAISDNDQDFAKQIITLFIDEVPAEVKNIREGLEDKDHKRVYQAAHKIKPTLDLLGMELAYDDVLAIEKWTKAEGRRKEIKDVVKSLRGHVENTLKEVKKNYNL
ncbi:Hpt domain-containing protein [Flavobacterium sp. RHBU_3]|uniref:Hpt domain-containing protein n=1 Tax=Flavobacterium sp. RHBU_3 TaxID=3391184 RepID=UPI0039854DA4